MPVSIGIDIGGTFTDVVVLDDTTSGLRYAKVPSTPPKLVNGFVQGIEKILGIVGAPPEEIQRIAHGTTVGTNAILEGKGAVLGILTTAGFEDTLFIGRQKRSDMYNIFLDAETPTFLAQRRRIIGIEERMEPKGNPLIPLDEDGVRKAAERLVNEYGVEAIAVCYLFSFANPAHEQRTKEIILGRYPQIKVSLSSTVDPRFREYERLCLTAFDAYVRPVMERYIEEARTELKKRDIGAPLQIMQSRGGVTNEEAILEKTVSTLLSGPAAGVIGGTYIGVQSGFPNVITLDMGGTSCDIALVEKGKPFIATEGKMGKYPLRQAMLDINTIGAGGGSIAWVDSGGGLRVGPQSAGASPGPACYGQGGEEPTVTDASLVLGYLNPAYFAGGAMSLDSASAKKAIETRIARPLSMDVLQGAAGIHKIVNNMMADELRLVSVMKGYDPRNFSLVAMGGAGPAHAGLLAEQASIARVIVPRSPGVLSALGLLVANIEHEQAKTYLAKAADVDICEIRAVFANLEELCSEKMERDKIASNPINVLRSAEMRYLGQSYEIEIPFPEGDITTSAIERVIARFHEAHKRIYGHSDSQSPAEFVSLRVVYSQSPFTEKLDIQVSSQGSPGHAAKEVRKAYFEKLGGLVDTPVYAREGLAPGVTLKGPAIVEQEDTTTVIYPGNEAYVDPQGNLIIHMAGAGAN